MLSYLEAMRIIAILLGLLSLAVPARADCVVLLHGLHRSEGSMAVLQKVLERQGYRTVNPDYPSTEAPIETLVETHVTPAVAACGYDRVHFVTHSMGGILVSAWLAVYRPADLGRVVMLAPPNRGSELIDFAEDYAFLSRLLGPAGMELGTGSASEPNSLGPAGFELGVIAGDVSFNPIYSWVIGGKDDGKVSVASTRIGGMTDHIVLPTSHTFIMNNPRVMAEVLEFLQNGRFDHMMTLSEALKRIWG